MTDEIAPRHENLVVHTGRLTREDYLRLMDEADCLVLTYDPVIYARKSSGVAWEAISLGLPMLAPARTWLEKEAREWDAGYQSYENHGVEGIAGEFAAFARRLPGLIEKSAQAAKSFQRQNGAGALLNQIGRLWAPRLLAASLTPQPQASQIPLLNIEKAGWSFPETLDGQIVRWVGKSFEIEFAWPFDAPWRLDVTAARLFGGEQVKEAKAFAGDQALPTSGQVGADRKSGVVTVSGAGDRHRPTHKVRVELPWAYKPDGDNRELGLLVQSVRVSPDQSVKALEEVGRIEVLTKVARTEQGFWLDRIVSGRAVMNPRGENWLHFTVRTEGGPEIAHAIELYVNGVPASLDRVAVSASVWAFRAKCGPDVLAAVGLWADWDLALRKAGAPPVGVADLRVSDSAEFSVLPGPRIEAPAQIGVAETRVVAAIAIDKADIAPREGKQTLFTARDISDQATGFYHLEPVDNGSSIRWTGPARESRFSLRIDRSSPVVLIVRFASLGQNRADQVSIKIDEKVYSLSEDSPEKDTFCIGPLSSTLDSAETRLILRVSQLMRPWEDGSADGRELGVALEWIKAEKWLEQEREAS